MLIVKSQETREGVSFRIIKDYAFKFMHINFHNYFYVKTSDYILYKEDFRKRFNSCIEKCQQHNKDFTIIYLANNFMRNQVKLWWEDEDRNCFTYEADIKANKRMLIDNTLDLKNEEIPYLFFDVETDDRLPLQKDDYGNVIPGNARILSFSAVDNKGKIYYEPLVSYDDISESILLKQIIKVFSDYGIITGWYSEKFDMPYIKGRCDSLNIDYGILDYINHLDYKELFIKYDKKSRPSYSLNAISNEVLHESKIDQEKGNGAIYKTWKSEPDKLKRYNIEDSNLIYKINLSRMFIEVSMKRANNAHCHIRNTMNNSDSGDFLLLREYRENNIIMDSKPNKEEVEERRKLGKIGGGYTTCFEPGFHENVNIWDFASEYPSVIESWNISPETFVDSIHKEEDIQRLDKEKYCITPADFDTVFHPHRIFRKDVMGVFPSVVKKLVEKRAKIKYTMNKYKDSDPDKYKQLYLEQYALKTDANSLYGILSYPMSRYYKFEVGDSVTTASRATLKSCNEQLVNWGCSVIGGDTDSSFVKLQNNTIDDINQKLVIFLKTWAERWNCKVNKLVFEHEKTFDTMLFAKKKHYAYKMDNKITIVGMEAIKSDTNVFAAKWQRKFIEQVLNKEVDDIAWEKEVDTIYRKVFNQELTPEELILIKALTKMPPDYEGFVIDSKTKKPKIKADGTIQKKAIPAHVKLAERLLTQGKDLYPGSKIQFIVIASKPILAISPEEFLKGSGKFIHKNRKKELYTFEFEGLYDSKYYWLRILKPLMKVIYAYYNRLPEWSWNLTTNEMKKILKDKEV